MSQANYKNVFSFESKFPGGTQSECTNISQYSDDAEENYNSTTVNMHGITEMTQTSHVLDNGTKVTYIRITCENGERLTVNAFEINK
jgi:hypothetical protein|tara:strand:+ start:378 stop:638 length:261 start_codon:yes stop_codon:yes gene_type:complete